MNYDKLTLSYELEQQARIAKSRDKIVARGKALAAGRVIPEDGDLPIGTGRRLKATVLFLDICAFSKRAAEDAWDQEVMLRVITFFIGEMVKIVEDHDGTVEKNTGDGLMAYFGDGAAETNGCQRAVACALTMFHAAEQFLNPEIRASGIDHGYITIAQVGRARGFGSIVAIGTTANIACKMLAAADDNEILIGEDVVGQLPEDWRPYATIKLEETGWVRRMGKQPYRFYHYNSRWRKPPVLLQGGAPVGR